MVMVVTEVLSRMWRPPGCSRKKPSPSNRSIDKTPEGGEMPCYHVGACIMSDTQTCLAARLSMSFHLGILDQTAISYSVSL
jgi:hypothetical protein